MQRTPREARIGPRPAREGAAGAARRRPGGAARRSTPPSRAEEKAVVNAASRRPRRRSQPTETEIDRQQRAARRRRPRTHRARREAATSRSRAASRAREAVERAKKALPAAWQKPLETAGLTEHMQLEGRVRGPHREGHRGEVHAAPGGPRRARPAPRRDRRSSKQEADAVPARTPAARPTTCKAEVAAARKELDAPQQGTARRPAAARRILDGYRQQRANSASSTRRSTPSTTATSCSRNCSAATGCSGTSSGRPSGRSSITPTPCSTGSAAGNSSCKLVGSGRRATDKALDLECSNRVTGGVADQRGVPERQPAVPRRGGAGAGHRPVRQQAAPADRERHHRRGLRLPRPRTAGR